MNNAPQLWDDASRKLGKAVYEAAASILKDAAKGHLRTMDEGEADVFLANLEGVHLALEFAPKGPKARRFEADADVVSYCFLDRQDPDLVISGEYALGLRLRF